MFWFLISFLIFSIYFGVFLITFRKSCAFVQNKIAMLYRKLYTSSLLNLGNNGIIRLILYEREWLRWNNCCYGTSALSIFAYILFTSTYNVSAVKLLELWLLFICWAYSWASIDKGWGRWNSSFTYPMVEQAD